MSARGSLQPRQSVSSLTLLALVIVVPTLYVGLLVLLGAALGVNPTPS